MSEIAASCSSGDRRTVSHSKALPECFQFGDNRSRAAGSGREDAEGVVGTGLPGRTQRLAFPSRPSGVSRHKDWRPAEWPVPGGTTVRLVDPTSVTTVPGLSTGASCVSMASKRPTGVQRITRSASATASARSMDQRSIDPNSWALLQSFPSVAVTHYLAGVSGSPQSQAQ